MKDAQPTPMPMGENASSPTSPSPSVIPPQRQEGESLANYLLKVRPLGLPTKDIAEAIDVTPQQLRSAAFTLSRRKVEDAPKSGKPTSGDVLEMRRTLAAIDPSDLKKATIRSVHALFPHLSESTAAAELAKAKAAHGIPSRGVNEPSSIPVESLPPLVPGQTLRSYVQTQQHVPAGVIADRLGISIGTVRSARSREKLTSTRLSSNEFFVALRALRNGDKVCFRDSFSPLIALSSFPRERVAEIRKLYDYYNHQRSHNPQLGSNDASHEMLARVASEAALAKLADLIPISANRTDSIAHLPEDKELLAAMKNVLDWLAKNQGVATPHWYADK